MRYWVGLTDRDWYAYLASQPDVEEVNFWQPSATIPVRLAEGAPFLFKLHKPNGGAVVGGGYFAHYTVLPAKVAWDVFGTMNGAATFRDMEGRVKRYRPDFDVHADRIGCMALVQPFFFPRDQWIDPPASWPASVQRGKTFDSSEGEGAILWQQVQARMAQLGQQSAVSETIAGDQRYGSPIEFVPRLGQGTFRAKIIDAYERRCAVTGERTLPVLEAAHIKPYSEIGTHSPDNGLLLRSDLHTLFDRGYVTVTPKLELRISHKIRDEFENGRDYYALEGRPIRPPAQPNPAPNRELLEWHGDVVFRG